MAIVVVFSFVAWMISQGFTPYVAVSTAVATLIATAVIVKPYRMATIATDILTRVALIARSLSTGTS